MHTHNKINEAMKQLSAEHQEILILVVVKSLSYSQAASYLDKSIIEVREALSEARAALEAMMNVPVPVKTKNYINPQSIGFFPSMAA